MTLTVKAVKFHRYYDCHMTAWLFWHHVWCSVAVLHLLENNQLPFTIPHQCLLAVAEAVEQSMGGCSGGVSLL